MIELLEDEFEFKNGLNTQVQNYPSVSLHLDLCALNHRIVLTHPVSDAHIFPSPSLISGGKIITKFPPPLSVRRGAGGHSFKAEKILEGQKGERENPS